MTSTNRGPAYPPPAMRAFTLALSALVAAGAFTGRTGEAAADSPWSLSPDQRRAFLQSYAPIILKEADEGSDGLGRDWITNYDFDGDGFYLPNNGENWSRELAGFVREGHPPEWRIRPTLYTSIVEFTREDVKSAVLFYHIYHAMDGTHTHDWERIEMRLDGLRGGPGSGERIRYVVLTRHHQSTGRRPPHEDLNFFETDEGRHLLVWQAAQSRRGRLRKGELHFVRSEVSPADLDRQVGLVRVGLDTGDEEAFHYVFVPRADPVAVGSWRARGIGACNAKSLASGAERAPVPARDVRRITYELQDLADVFPHQWRVPGNGSWGEPAIPVLLEGPLVDEDGTEVVPAGLQEFRNGALDLHFGRDDGRGFLGKNAFWGTYLFERKGWFGNTGFLGQALDGEAPRAARCLANGLPRCANGALWQHDFFVHEGVRARGRAENEKGRWLEGRWYEADAGGFDGRWAQLFPDHPEPDVSCAAVSASPARARVESEEATEEENSGDLIALVDPPYDTSRGRTLYPVRLRFDSRFIVDSDFGATDATFYNPKGQLRLTVPVAAGTSFRFFAEGEALISDWDGTTDLFDVGPTSSEPFDTLYSGGLSLQGAHVVGHSSILADSEEWAVVGVGRVSSNFESGADFEDSITGGGSIGVSYRVDDAVGIVTGISVSSRLDAKSVQVMPLFSLAWHASERLRIQGNTRGARIDFDLTDTVRLFARARIQSERYRLDRRSGPTGAGTVRDRSIPVGLGVLWKFHERLRLSLFGGVVAYHQIRTYDGDRHEIGSITSDPTPVFEIRIDLRP